MTMNADLKVSLRTDISSLRSESQISDLTYLRFEI